MSFKAAGLKLMCAYMSCHITTRSAIQTKDDECENVRQLRPLYTRYYAKLGPLQLFTIALLDPPIAPALLVLQLKNLKIINGNCSDHYARDDL